MSWCECLVCAFFFMLLMNSAHTRAIPDKLAMIQCNITNSYNMIHSTLMNIQNIRNILCQLCLHICFCITSTAHEMLRMLEEVLDTWLTTFCNCNAVLRLARNESKTYNHKWMHLGRDTSKRAHIRSRPVLDQATDQGCFKRFSKILSKSK